MNEIEKKIARILRFVSNKKINYGEIINKRDNEIKQNEYKLLSIENLNKKLNEKISKLEKDRLNLNKVTKTYKHYYGEIDVDNINEDSYNKYDGDANVLDHLVSINKNQFNSNQLEAIRYDMEKNLRIIAGAGSGKTQTICAKAFYLKSMLEVSGKKIMMCTFTKKAQLELEERISEFEGNKTDINVRTFDSWFMNEYNEIKKMPLEHKFRIIKSSGVESDKYRNIVYSLIKKHDLYKFNDYEDRKISDRITYWCNMDIDRDAIIDSIKINFDDNKGVESSQGKLSKVFQKFLLDLDIEKANKQAYIFEDFTKGLYMFLKEYPEVQEELRLKYDYIFIDEFQDVNPIQSNIIKLICDGSENSPKLIIVGDDDQSIYFFRGSSPSFIKNFDRDFESHTIELMTNYRSKKNIVNCANRLIHNNIQSRISKVMMPYSKNNGILVVQAKDSFSKEAEYICLKVQDHYSIEKKYSKNVIIYPTKNNLKILMKKLQDNKIPYVIEKNNEELQIFSISEFKRLFDELIKINDFNSDKSKFDGLIRYAFLKCYISSKVIDSYDKNEILNKPILIDEICGNNVKKSNAKLIREWCEFILEIKTMNEVDFKIEKIVNYWLKLPVINNEISVEEKNLIKETVKKYDTFKKIHEYYKFLVAKQDENMKNLEKYNKGTHDAVLLLTIHKSKGLQFDNVFLKGIYKNSLPNSYVRKLESIEVKQEQNKANPPTLIDEQRRLMYVAITRAKNNLYITYPKKVNDKLVENSIFLKELNIK